MRGVTIKQLPENPHLVNVPTPVTAQQQVDTRVQEKRLAARVLQVEEQETITGDKIESPSREVPNAVLNVDVMPANNSMSHSASVEDMEDEESPEHRAGGSKEEETAMTKEQLKQEQEVDDEKGKHQGEQAKEERCKTWKKWKGPSQRHHCRWRARHMHVTRTK